MKHFIYSSAITLLFLGVVIVPNAHAETTNASTSMLEQVKALMTKIEELQKQLSALKGEVRDVIKSGITEGSTGEDVKKIQELLATDNTIYPEGKVTGYYGPLTREALKRFQTRHELKVTGTLDEETKALLEEYLGERTNGKIPPGLLTAPGIAKKVELRYKEECEKKGEGLGLFCSKLKIKYKMEDDGKVEVEIEDESEDDDEDAEDDDEDAEDDEDEDDSDDEDEDEDEDD